MRRVALSFVLTVALTVAVGVPPAGAATVGVSVRDDFFSPSSVSIARGDTVRWTNSGRDRHTTTGNSPLSLWSAALSPGASYSRAFVGAGTYPYRCTFHSDMRGTVKVPISVAPASGTAATTFTVTWASAPAPTGFRYIVEKQNPGGAFAVWATTTAKSKTFKTATRGTYAFRSKLQRISNLASSGYSASKTITVS